MRNNRSNKGFTLIELLIVIAIIGILAAVLIPNLMGARTAAAQRAAQAHSSGVYTVLVAALATESGSTSDDFVGTDCQGGATVTAGGVDYEVNAAPAGTTCAIAANGDDDFEVTVTHTASGQAYVNGVEQ